MTYEELSGRLAEAIGNALHQLDCVAIEAAQSELSAALLEYQSARGLSQTREALRLAVSRQADAAYNRGSDDVGDWLMSTIDPDWPGIDTRYSCLCYTDEPIALYDNDDDCEPLPAA